MGTLKAVAFEVLRFNPGCDHSDWKHTLIEQYGTEVVEACGNNPFEVYADLDNLWESPYYDKNSDIEYTFAEWAEVFATDRSAEIYELLVDAKCKAK